MPLDFQLHAEPLLSRHALDRAAHLREDDEALAAGWSSALVMRVDRRGRFRTDFGPHGGRRLVLDPAFDLYEQPPRHALFLGRGDDGRHVWAIGVDELTENPDTMGLREAAAELPEADAALATEAVALLNWHREIVRERDPQHHHRKQQAGWAGTDPFHGDLEFPRTDAAVICLVHDSHRQVLLARNPRWPEARYSVLAGFVEPGESLEHCVVREIKEEVGLDVDRVRYLGSQPWPFPRSLMVGFHALGDPDAPLTLDDDEITEARWFDVDDVRDALEGVGDGQLVLPPTISIAHVMIESWVRAVHAVEGDSREDR